MTEPPLTQLGQTVQTPPSPQDQSWNASRTRIRASITSRYT